jgi:tetratricopeptide (TPR) repeat protein
VILHRCLDSMDSTAGLTVARRRKHRAAVALATLAVAVAAGCTLSSKFQNAEGVRRYQQAAYHGALSSFQQAVHSDPNNPDAYYNVAATHHQLGKLNSDQQQLEQAEHFYNQCLDRNPDHRDCHRGLAVLLVEQERSDEAFNLVKGWAARSPGLADPRIELARLYDEFGDKPEAKQQLIQALAIEPNNARALAALGKVREELGEHSQALADYQRSLYLDQFQPEVAARVAALQAGLGPTPLAAPAGPRTVNNPSPTAGLRR